MKFLLKIGLFFLVAITTSSGKEFGGLKGFKELVEQSRGVVLGNWADGGATITLLEAEVSSENFKDFKDALRKSDVGEAKRFLLGPGLVCVLVDKDRSPLFCVSFPRTTIPYNSAKVHSVFVKNGTVNVDDLLFSSDEYLLLPEREANAGNEESVVNQVFKIWEKEMRIRSKERRMRGGDTLHDEK